MAPKTRLHLPSASPLSNSTRLDSTDASVRKIFSRLARTSLLELVVGWLDDDAGKALAPPRLGAENADHDSIDEPARSLEELRKLYQELKERKGGREDALDRVLAGDWGHGISLQQLAMADTRYLLDHPQSQRWTAWEVVDAVAESRPARSTKKPEPPKSSVHGPPFHAPSFLRNLQNEIGSLAKSHYHLARVASLSITLLRIQSYDTPFPNLRGNAKNGPIPSSTTIYIAIPDNSPLVFVSQSAQGSNATASEANAMRRWVIDALPKALSKPGKRYRLEATSSEITSLSTLAAARRTASETASAGGWSIFASGSAEDGPLHDFAGERDGKDTLTHRKGLSAVDETPSQSGGLRNKRKAEPSSHDVPLPRKRRMHAQARFGTSALQNDGKGTEKFDVEIRDPFPKDPVQPNDATPPMAQESSPGPQASPRRTPPTPHPHAGLEGDGAPPRWKPRVQVRFRGSHLFAGIRKLVEAGAVDGVTMPGWMTGEDGIGAGVIRGGRMVGRRDTG